MALFECCKLTKEMFCHVDVVSDIISTFCIALIGTMSAVIVIITGLKDSYYMRIYIAHGHFKRYVFLYFFTIISLVLTHLFSIAAFYSIIWFDLMLASMIVNIIQFIFIISITWSVYNKSPK